MFSQPTLSISPIFFVVKFFSVRGENNKKSSVKQMEDKKIKGKQRNMKGYQKYGHDASCLKTIITTKKRKQQNKKKTQQNKKRKTNIQQMPSVFIIENSAV